MTSECIISNKCLFICVCTSDCVCEFVPLCLCIYVFVCARAYVCVRVYVCKVMHLLTTPPHFPLCLNLESCVWQPLSLKDLLCTESLPSGFLWLAYCFPILTETMLCSCQKELADWTFVCEPPQCSFQASLPATGYPGRLLVTRNPFPV